MATTPILNLSPQWSASQKTSVAYHSTKLKDGYQQDAEAGANSITESWQVSRFCRTKAEADAIVAELSVYAGDQGFQWRPNSQYPFRVYTCDKWTVTEIALNKFRISGTFDEDVSGECVELLNNIDVVELNGWLAGANTFLATYTRNTLPLIANTFNGQPYLLVNAFHDVLGRGGYFPPSAGTSEGQFLAIRASLLAWQVTGIESWRQRAIGFASSLEPVLYDGALVPANTNTIWTPHWLYNVKAPFTSKGKTAANPENSGYFDLVVSFVNGVGQIPIGTPNDGDKLSDIFAVYATGAKLLWQNADAPVVFGQEYEVSYWVVNFMLQGQRFRIFPTSAANNGSPPQVTTDPAGRIVLTTPFTGNLKIAYAAYTGAVIPVNKNFEAWPMWRAMLPGEIQTAFDTLPWAWEAYDLLFQATNDAKWQRAREATGYTTIVASEVQNPTHWYKPESNSDPFSYPGTQTVQVNNSNGFTASRETGANLTNALRLQVAAAPAGSFPSIEVQNFAVQAQIDDDTTVQAQVAQNVTAVLQISLSLSPDAFDFSKNYFVNWLVNSGSTAFTTRTFLPEDFFLWNSSLVWHFAIADDPLYGFSEDGGSRSLGQAQESIDYKGKTLSQCVATATINTGASGFAGVGANLLAKQIRRPPRIAFRNSKQITLQIRDGSGVNWRTTVAASNAIRVVQFDWNDFTGTGDPDTENDIQAIDFLAVQGEGSTSIGLWWIAENARREPQQLPYPCASYKGAIVSRTRTAHTVWIGNFRPLNSPSDALRYSPGVWPFTLNLINGAIDAWRGIPMAGYMNPYGWYVLGRMDRADQQLRFMLDSQAAYTQRTGFVGGFVQGFKWGYWDAAEYYGGLNEFTDDTIDPNDSWSGYFYRPIVDTAKFWYYNKNNAKARAIVMNSLSWLDKHFLQTNTNQPPTDFPANGYFQVNYHEPHAAALILRAALFANMAGGSPSVTFRLISRMLLYLRSQYTNTGAMAGSWTVGQPVFNATLKEYFGFWHFEIIETVALLIRHRLDLVLPPCGTQL